MREEGVGGEGGGGERGGRRGWEGQTEHVSMHSCRSSEHKKKFREWRKNHYDEFFAVKRAREMRKVNYY